MKFKDYLVIFKEKIKQKLNRIEVFISTFLAEIFVIGGAFSIIYATFLINKIAGFYVSGFILFSGGILLAKLRG